MRCDREHLRGSEIESREAIKQSPEVEAQFMEKHVKVSRLANSFQSRKS